MPVPLRMPSERDLPPGPRRQFAGELFNLFRLARRPPLSEISERILNDEELTGTASRETIRRMLIGKTVPTWDTAFAAFKVLCDMAGVDPSDRRWADNNSFDVPSYQEAFTSAWNDAIDDDPRDIRPQHPTLANPWGQVASGVKGSFDEPPF